MLKSHVSGFIKLLQQYIIYCLEVAKMRTCIYDLFYLKTKKTSTLLRKYSVRINGSSICLQIHVLPMFLYRQLNCYKICCLHVHIANDSQYFFWENPIILTISPQNRGLYSNLGTKKEPINNHDFPFISIFCHLEEWFEWVF